MVETEGIAKRSPACTYRRDRRGVYKEGFGRVTD